MKTLLLLLMAATVVVVGIAVKRNNTEKPKAHSRNKAQPKKLVEDDFDIWLKVFGDQKKGIREFDLFGTRAAIAWSDGGTEIIVICIKAFRNKEPTTRSWEYFEFDVDKKYWTDAAPQGSPARIREELKKIGLLQKLGKVNSFRRIENGTLWPSLCHAIHARPPNYCIESPKESRW